MMSCCHRRVRCDAPTGDIGRGDCSARSMIGANAVRIRRLLQTSHTVPPVRRDACGARGHSHAQPTHHRRVDDWPRGSSSQADLAGPPAPRRARASRRRCASSSKRPSAPRPSSSRASSRSGSRRVSPSSSRCRPSSCRCWTTGRRTRPAPCTGTCVRDNSSMYPLQVGAFAAFLGSPHQRRLVRRVADGSPDRASEHRPLCDPGPRLHDRLTRTTRRSSRGHVRPPGDRRREAGIRT
jgi:hypothetical protein